MANSASARKRSIQSEKRRKRNASLRSSFRTAVKKIRVAITKGSQEEAVKVYETEVSIIDKVCSKGIVHANKASRHKSRLMQQIKALSA